MPLFRQLEFAFRSTGILPAKQPSVWLGELRTEPESEIPGDAATDNAMLVRIARAFLRAQGARRIAAEIRVEWNPRLKTCAGRADYRARLITLNPQLVHHPGEIDRTLRHELAHILARFRAGRRRVSPHGAEWRQACHDLGIGDEKRCHSLPFTTTERRRRFLYRCPVCAREFPRVRRIRRAVACLACCRAHSRGRFDSRFRLRLANSSKI